METYSSLKEHFLEYIKSKKLPELTEPQDRFVNTIIQRILDKKCKYMGNVINCASNDSDDFIALALDMYIGGKGKNIAYTHLMNRFYLGKLHDTGLDLWSDKYIRTFSLKLVHH